MTLVAYLKVMQIQNLIKRGSSAHALLPGSFLVCYVNFDLLHRAEVYSA